MQGAPAPGIATAAINVKTKSRSPDMPRSVPERPYRKPRENHASTENGRSSVRMDGG